MVKNTYSDNKAFDKECAYRTLELINQWINNVDTKSSFGLALAAAVMGLLFYNAGKTPSVIIKAMEEVKRDGITITSVIEVVVVLVAFILLFTAVACFISSLKGRIKNSSGKHSLLFFGNIASMSLNDFKSKIFSMNEKDFERDLAEQIHTNSQICAAKFKAYNCGMRSLTLAIVVAAISLLSGWI